MDYSLKNWIWWSLGVPYNSADQASPSLYAQDLYFLYLTINIGAINKFQPGKNIGKINTDLWTARCYTEIQVTSELKIYLHDIAVTLQGSDSWPNSCKGDTLNHFWKIIQFQQACSPQDTTSVLSSIKEQKCKIGFIPNLRQGEETACF